MFLTFLTPEHGDYFGVFADALALQHHGRFERRQATRLLYNITFFCLMDGEARGENTGGSYCPFERRKRHEIDFVERRYLRE